MLVLRSCVWTRFARRIVLVVAVSFRTGYLAAFVRFVNRIFLFLLLVLFFCLYFNLLFQFFFLFLFIRPVIPNPPRSMRLTHQPPLSIPSNRYLCTIPFRRQKINLAPALPMRVVHPTIPNRTLRIERRACARTPILWVFGHPEDAVMIRGAGTLGTGAVGHAHVA
ncbi:hypothetical protein EJ04DRAFT_510028 [Polyplosphaeria fusca]|uniref:Uncharacterized protein n=1 Tax=Polyplosphaeria fusca TaxID=682080 RepID=A0A9P4V2V5_9PLEO|nr:hypothetical protein EJ04DRAFT_510028 [Polyplosphaeria fusca]